MPKRLLVTRHAKSSWKSGSMTDHERPLNGRGRRDAPRVAAHIVGLGWSPEFVISSDSQRTRETLALMAEVFEPEPRIEFTRDLYLAGPSDVQAALARVPDSVETVMVLGHNEGWEDVVTWLSGCSERLTTANAALLSWRPAAGGPESWSAALADAPGWTLHQVVRPKELS
ncbi:MAG: histidine phosphatase family protein [Planctomycetes bacterium]|nr:histidine phosphatase family protein [Planctomycetota bacterium]